ncbi:hypothetical protein CGRA01v4_09341 [Colletotrichum graminicola]|nr:hypothetical protein CGRA01v4_09341 [Colletotrichum graminicola]
MRLVTKRNRVRPYKVENLFPRCVHKRSSPLERPKPKHCGIGTMNDETEMWAWKIPMLPCRSFGALAVNYHVVRANLVSITESLTSDVTGNVCSR